jgi:penicillin G amidase
MSSRRADFRPRLRVVPLLSALALSLLTAGFLAGCDDEEPPLSALGTAGTAGAGGSTAGTGGTAGASGGEAGGDAGAAGSAGDGGSAGSGPVVNFDSPYEAVPEQSVTKVAALKGGVDLVRDKFGVPHIVADNLTDASYVQGYVMAEDRFIEMDFIRRSAAGTLAKLAGSLDPTLLDDDIRVRAHHLRATAQKGFDTLKASSDPTDKLLVETLTQFSKGVNAWRDDLLAGKHTLPPGIDFLYTNDSVEPWSEIDSLVLAEYQAFSLAFDADGDIFRSQLAAADKTAFGAALDAQKKAREGFWKDYTRSAPFDATHTLPGGWDNLEKQALFTPGPGEGPAGAHAQADDGRMALFEATRPNTAGVGLDRLNDPTRGSNNWVIGPGLTSSGHTIVSNDTHLQLLNPAVFYLVHVTAKNPAYDVMGVQFPGIPLVTLGMNRHLAWGGTVNYIDVTDVYEENLVECTGGDTTVPCVSFKGAPVAAVPRKEVFEVGSLGVVDKTIEVTMYDVPHHGPIVPRVLGDHSGIEALGTKELSVRYTGHESAPLIRAIYNLNIAKTVDEGKKALEADFKYGGQNWVLGDDQGNFGWTQTIRVPRRAPGFAPYLVLPGDGTAEWQGDLPAKYIPHAVNPAQGYLATANADPIGVTDGNDPFFGQPEVDGSPLYLGSDYDPGTRVGRITKRIEAGTKDGKKLSLDDMSSIQGDVITEWGEVWAPVYLDAVKSLDEEIKTPGTHPELTAIAGTATARSKGLLGQVQTIVEGWTFNTPAGVEDANETPESIRDSQATTLVSTFFTSFAQKTLLDEAKLIGVNRLSGSGVNKLMAELLQHPENLETKLSDATGDPVLFDDLNTPEVESKRQIAAQAVLEALEKVATKLGDDPNGWRWGKIHTLQTKFFGPVSSLFLPPGMDPTYPDGYPRHGGDGTVDVGNHGADDDVYSFGNGAAIRFTCELDPEKGPRARNVLPGGQIFQPDSPHYKDQMELWRKNQTRDLPFSAAEVVTDATDEQATNKLGRRRFTP